MISVIVQKFTKMVIILIILLITLNGSVLGQDQKYCDPSLCTSWNGEIEPHIGCPGNAPNYCPPDTVEIVMTQGWIDYIVHKHNKFRNDLAGGGVGQFPAASRMPLMVRLSYFNVFFINGI